LQVVEYVRLNINAERGILCCLILQLQSTDKVGSNYVTALP